MVRIGGRSKGCATCLKRKIRCDERIPECSQCLNGGRKCPGAVSGMVFLTSVTKQPKPRETKNGRRLSIQNDASLPQLALDTAHILRKRPTLSTNSECSFETDRDFQTKSTLLFMGPIDEPGVQHNATQSNHLCYPHFMQVDNQQLLTQHALSCFIEFFAKNPPAKTGLRSWMHMLPDLLSSAKSSSVKSHIIAASTVYMGSVSNDKAIMIEGYRWYDSSLKRQRRQLQISTCRNTPPTVEEICMPLMLSFFEVICSTSPTAYFQHIMGAARLLEARGPEACKSGILHQLFQTVRIQMIYPSITMKAASIFANEKWLTVPFSSRPKTVFDRIVDILIRLPLLASNFACGSVAESTLSIELKGFKDSLDLLWDDLRGKASSHGWEGDFFQDKLGFDFNHPTWKTDGCTATPDAFTSSMIALYSTARILTHSLSSQMWTPHISCEDQIFAHAASILHAAEFLTEHDIGCAYLRLTLPLKVVGLLSPDVTHRIRARTLLETWRRRTAMRGICEVVLLEMENEPTSLLFSRSKERKGGSFYGASSEHPLPRSGNSPPLAS